VSNLDLDQYIKFFKALASEERLKMLILLMENQEMVPQNIEKHFFLEQSTTSHHLNTLRRAGIAKIRKEGRFIYYAIDYDNFRDMLEKFKKDFLSNKKNKYISESDNPDKTNRG
jgi:ArsR family transcriptional regulator, lead/cadmium/zinc/bismuth-responsive transcriptional repressor